MRVWLVFSALAMIGVSCVPIYEQVDQNELIAMGMRAEVESVTVDFSNLRERGVYVHNGGKRIWFPIFAEWVSPKPEPGMSSFKWESEFVCSQYLPVVGDSLFKPKGSRKILVHKKRDRAIDSVLIVERALMEKATKIRFRIHQKESNNDANNPQS